MQTIAKKDVQDLALFSNQPLFSEKLHVGRPNMGSREDFLARVEGILDRRWFTNSGPNLIELENRLAAFIGVKHCIAVCNATIGLEVLAHALELTGEVIVPSFTFVATAHSLHWQKITPVFCDVNPISHVVDVDSVRKLITNRTSAILGVHVWGSPCEIEALTKLAAEFKITLIFDAAHALGCSFNGKMLGNFGTAEVFSFHATKFFNSFEGGAITTNNDALAKKIRLMINFGFSGLDTVTHQGTNGKMSEISAAMGLTSLDSIDKFIEKNRSNYHRYQEGFSKIQGIRLFEYDEKERCNFQYIVVEIDEPAFGIDRDLLVKILHSENILARKYFYPGVHMMEPYKSNFPNARNHLKETEALSSRVLSLPNGTAVTDNDIAAIVGLIKFCSLNAPEIFKASYSL